MIVVVGGIESALQITDNMLTAQIIQIKQYKTYTYEKLRR